MPKRQRGIHLFLIALVSLLLACAAEKPSGCPVPPKGFSQTDLVGTWSSTKAGEDSRIIIQGDGLYKQIMRVDRTGFNYEGDWKPWRITYSEKGLPYLHLEGLLMCAYWSAMDCSTGQTGLTPLHIGDTKDPFTGEYYWYDDCERHWVNTPGEGVFMVFADHKYKRDPRVIRLVPFTKSSDGTTGPSFELREP